MLIRLDLQRISRNGSCSCVIIQKAVMRHLGWITGQSVVVEVLDDNTLRIRKPTYEDLGPQVPRARRLPMPVAVTE